ncbi:protein EMSY-LIKE 3 isoform X2 [Mercurialis annua]|uniref:protein EMSY-LIKE 3 isoform X2 n=1 Tax=Mercurialis annua TaxID=3986 RepID=UPI00215F4854|nr:protein EMSY-LIKE 3 isoform X2 [Mercurialis annua]
MDYELSDSSGTDDDLPPPHRNRFQSGVRPVGNGRPAVLGSALIPRLHNDMETQIHNIEQEAYTSVLRAFIAQSDALTWEKESLITELRKELRVSDEEHREHLSRVNTDDTIRRIREWRKTNGLPPSMPSTAQPAPTVSASRKKQKTLQSVASQSMGAPSPALPSMEPSSSTLRRGPAPGPRSKKPKSSMQYSSAGLTGRDQAVNRNSSGPFAANEPAETATNDPLVGKTIWTRWPEDNNFYQAFIYKYEPHVGRHVLIYDKGTPDETWESVDLKEISPEDIRWGEEDPGIPHRGGRPGPGRGNKKVMARGGGFNGAGRGRGNTKGQSRKDIPLAQNGIGKRVLGDIEILHTDTLIKEVEKLFGANHPDPMEIEKAKKVLKEHERALIDAIARLEDASDGESDEKRDLFSQEQSMERDGRWRS